MLGLFITPVQLADAGSNTVLVEDTESMVDYVITGGTLEKITPDWSAR